MNKSLFLLIFRRITQSFWFIPTGLFLFAILIAFVLTGTDHWIGLSQKIDHVDWLYANSPDGARAVLSTIAGSMITVAGVLISTTVVVLTLASQQYGPRLVKNFIEDRPSQIVIGSFAACFIYSILVMRNIRSGEIEFVPQLSILVAVLSAVICIGMMIYFIHHISIAIQVQSIMERVHNDLDGLVEAVFPENLSQALETPGNQLDSEVVAKKLANKTLSAVNTTRPGYLQAVRSERLIKFAQENSLVVKLLVQPGSFLIKNEQLCQALAEQSLSQDAIDSLLSCFVFGRFPTCEQDILFPIKQLEEMAIRALSPGINDPHTAIECIDYLATSLRAIALRPFPSPYRADPQGELRVISPVHNFEKILRVAFQQIHHYGREDINVVNRIFMALQKIGQNAQLTVARRDTLALFAKELLDKSESCASSEGDKKKIRQAYQAAVRTHLSERTAQA
ncbi:DUF2254 domain-containing protein [Coraliomargarita sp. SDUM461004]|uniref:DUF2254 domain-containing protein n=1 Tax=Thalassobacterium sedimentorum TaxID=3041258 RepID=A0ABU1AHH8_9BACT|nr:DUF2254 domain-containing protein [Coraliomargarita sp. SDUM461004]MDQ8193088.1 DUF2254 domain-containing protein [Coraliomargarita sp. SDUM461004]